MLKSVLCIGIFITLSSSCIQAESLDELKHKYVEMIMECASDYPLTIEDLEQLKNKQMPDHEAVKCLFACAYKKAGMMNEEGYLSIDGVNQISNQYLSNDPDKMMKSKQFTEACKIVNDIQVNDGSKGCERAALIFKCSVEKSPEFDFV